MQAVRTRLPGRLATLGVAVLAGATALTAAALADGAQAAQAATTYKVLFDNTKAETAGCSSPGQKLLNPGFESGNVNWSASSGVIGQYGSSGEPPHSGSWDAWLDGYGVTTTDTVSQSVTIPAGCTAVLSFYLHIDTAETTTTIAYDTLTVKLGSTTLATYSNLNHNSGYAQKNFNVSSFAGQTVTLTFTGKEDNQLQTSFVIDDITLTLS
ncbi:MAG TPA: hypothetical protein VJ851_06410 [Jatrophihabitans sp.]|nr:hypothetical protein [Jatrophihabitans sp.]